MWNSMEKLWKSFFHFSDVRGMDYPRPLITFPSASERAATVPCPKSFLLSSSMGHCAAPLQLLGIPGRCCQQAPCDKWHLLPGCQCSLPWERWCLGGNTGQALSVTARWANVPLRHRVRLCLCHTPRSPPATPNQGQELRDCCPAPSLLVCSSPYNTLGHFCSHLYSSLCSHKLMRFGPRSSWAKGMFLLNHWEGAEIRASPHILLLCLPEIWSNNCMVTSKIKTDSQDWLVLGDYLFFFPISSEQSSCLPISKLLLSQCCRVYIHLLWYTTGLGVLSFNLLDFTWNQVKNKWCSQNQALSSLYNEVAGRSSLDCLSLFFPFWIRK